MLTVTQMLRERGVVGKFVEFFGEGLPNLPLADRATIGNMSPELGATCAIFPVDAETLRYLEFSGRPPERVELVEAYCKEQGLFHDEGSEEAAYSDTLELDLGDVEPSLAGPEAPAGPRGALGRGQDFRAELEEYAGDGALNGLRRGGRRVVPGQRPAHEQRRRRRAPRSGTATRSAGTAVAERERGLRPRRRW